MTQKQTILKAFHDNQNVLTLGHVLQYPWGYKFASRCADLRKDGFNILCRQGKTASENTYLLMEPVGNQMAFFPEPNSI